MRLGGTRVLIKGDGVAASCCEFLLAKAGLEVSLERGERPKVPAVMLAESTQRLMCDVFEDDKLFEGLPRITNRVVSWGSKFSEPLTLPHSAVVVAEDDLLHRIQTKLPSAEASPDEANWTIYTSRQLPQNTVVHHFGSRVASASAVQLKPQASSASCWIESLASGWLFLVPVGDRSAWLLSVGGSIDAMLGESRLVADQVAECTPTGRTFPSYPRIADPLCGNNWLACGTAALGFDPLCGEGTGNAVREAILAAAVADAVLKGADSKAAVRHYRGRLLAGFARHLEFCKQFYSDGDSGQWWDAELASTDRGLDWVRSARDDSKRPAFRLNGFALEPIQW